MKHLAVSFTSTFIVWLITTMTMGIKLPLFQLFIIACLAFLVSKQTRED